MSYGPRCERRLNIRTRKLLSFAFSAKVGSTFPSCFRLGPNVKRAEGLA